MLTTGKEAIPLYVQITDLLVSRISRGVWQPGDLIPSEVKLAEELNVSQGTIRKAITELAENNVLVRKQGRGTFVSNHDSRRALFHFFHIADHNGKKVMPDSEVLDCRQKKATRREADRLRLDADEPVIKIKRIRKLGSRPTIVETIALPHSRFSKLDNQKERHLPNMLYELYEKRFGITIHRAEEQLRAAVAGRQEAKLLELEEGAPLLVIERIAFTLDGIPVELRISRCNTKHHHYQTTLM